MSNDVATFDKSIDYAYAGGVLLCVTCAALAAGIFFKNFHCTFYNFKILKL
jgi:hypothetical protein